MSANQRGGVAFRVRRFWEASAASVTLSITLHSLRSLRINSSMSDVLRRIINKQRNKRTTTPKPMHHSSICLESSFGLIKHLIQPIISPIKVVFINIHARRTSIAVVLSGLLSTNNKIPPNNDVGHPNNKKNDIMPSNASRLNIHSKSARAHTKTLNRKPEIVICKIKFFIEGNAFLIIANAIRERTNITRKNNNKTRALNKSSKNMSRYCIIIASPLFNRPRDKINHNL